jgi:polar amino acid transport system substrate-binding protein
MKLQTRAGMLLAALFLVTACGGPAASPGTSPADSPAGSPADSPAATQGGDSEDVLARVRDQGVIRVSTDPDYAPQSFITESGDYDGFDIDVAREVAERLGVEIQWETPDWDAITAGSWSDRWDMSVGSMTVTPEREEVLDFTQPYYYTPAQIAVTEGSDFASIDDLAGEVACVGEDTTYLYWLEGNLELGSGGEIVRDAPEGMTATTFPTDANCAESIRSGRTEFAVFISAEAVIDEAIAAGTPIEKLGEPIFYEPLAIAFDKSGPAHDELVAEVDRIIGEMHEDGTLTELSQKWYDGEDLTQAR